MEWLGGAGELEQSWMEKTGECEKWGSGAGKSGVVGFGGDRGTAAGWGWGGGPPFVDQALVWGKGHRDPQGLSAPTVCSPVLDLVHAKVTLFPCFCPQPRFWPRWPCTVGVSLGPVLGPVHSRAEAVTPGFGLTEKVRLGDLAC